MSKCKNNMMINKIVTRCLVNYMTGTALVEYKVLSNHNDDLKGKNISNLHKKYIHISNVKEKRKTCGAFLINMC